MPANKGKGPLDPRRTGGILQRPAGIGEPKAPNVSAMVRQRFQGARPEILAATESAIRSAIGDGRLPNNEASIAHALDAALIMRKDPSIERMSQVRARNPAVTSNIFQLANELKIRLGAEKRELGPEGEAKRARSESVVRKEQFTALPPNQKLAVRVFAGEIMKYEMGDDKGQAFYDGLRRGLQGSEAEKDAQIGLAIGLAEAVMNKPAIRARRAFKR